MRDHKPEHDKLPVSFSDPWSEREKKVKHFRKKKVMIQAEGSASFPFLYSAMFLFSRQANS